MDNSKALTSPGQEKLHNLNSTAFRVYKILQWLQDKPLSMEELNHRFSQEPLIQKHFSSDSIGLYINTLKQLGCAISRPSKNNQFRYELISHPFGVLYTVDEIQTLIKAKSLAEGHFSYQEILNLDRFLKRVLRWSSIPNRDQWLQEMFTKSRSIDYESQTKKIEKLQHAISTQQLLEITYQSPVNGIDRFFVLPEKLLYQRGVLYLQGTALNHTEPLLLRVERIQTYALTENPEIHQQLIQMSQGLQPTFKIQLIGATPQTFQSFGFSEKIQFFPGRSPAFLEITLQTRDFFMLKQKLLENGWPFKIIEPKNFKDEMVTTLSSMRQKYHHDPI